VPHLTQYQLNCFTGSTSAVFGLELARDHIQHDRVPSRPSSSDRPALARPRQAGSAGDRVYKGEGPSCGSVQLALGSSGGEKNFSGCAASEAVRSRGKPFSSRYRGRVNQKVVPCPACESTPTEPPWAVIDMRKKIMEVKSTSLKHDDGHHVVVLVVGNSRTSIFASESIEEAQALCHEVTLAMLARR
jgi:hypothetical protein